MSALTLTLTLKSNLTQRVDMSPLTVDKVAENSIDDIKAISLRSGKRSLRVDELFDVSGQAGDRLVIKNSCDKLDYIGRGQTHGKITVDGDVGAYMGMQMEEGSLTVNGDVGIFAGCEMSGGEIVINGNAGELLGAPLPGNKQGMSGGIILVKGNAGERLGDRMRRGIILVEGDTADYCGSRMTAGTIAVMGETGRYLGYSMSRGTILLWNKPQIPPTFNDCGLHTLTFLALFFASIRHLDSTMSEPSAVFNRIHRYGGDMSGVGRGEILVKVQ